MSVQKQLEKYNRKSANQSPETFLEKLKLYYYQDEATMLQHDEIITLTKDQEKKLHLLEETWGLLIKSSPSEVIDHITKKYDVVERTARNYIAQAQELFGSVDMIKKDTQRVMRIRQREEAIKIIRDESADSLSAYEREMLIHLNRKEIEKMLGLDKDDDLSMEEILEKLQFPEVTISTNPEVLDIGHKEV